MTGVFNDTTGVFNDTTKIFIYSLSNKQKALCNFVWTLSGSVKTFPWALKKIMTDFRAMGSSTGLCRGHDHGSLKKKKPRRKKKQT